MIRTYSAAPDIHVLTSSFPVPGFGSIPINAFVLDGSEPVLVDTGPVVEKDDFLRALRSVIDPADLKWIWLTHTDFDHIGALGDLLAQNPRVKVITTFLGVGIMSLFAPLPLERVQLLNPGQQVVIGDRRLRAFRPPTFDNPITTGVYDEQSGVLFSADSFGAILSAVPDDASELSDDELRQGQVFWATVDSPWLHATDTAVFAKTLNAIRELNPSFIMSSHLPAARRSTTERLLKSLEAVPASQPFVGPDQAALESLLANMSGR